MDFIKGTRNSDGGQSIFALQATANRGQTSRIVSSLLLGAPVSVARAYVDLVVTEYGIADHREASIEHRAKRLIAIAALQFRDGLAR